MISGYRYVPTFYGNVLVRRDRKRAVEKTGSGEDLSDASRFVKLYIPIQLVDTLLTVFPGQEQLQAVLKIGKVLMGRVWAAARTALG